MSTIAGDSARANVRRVRAAVEEAAKAAGRGADDVTIVGVVKSVGVEEARVLLDCGLPDLAENRPEALAAKATDPSLAAARWHLIGAYQRKKIRDTLSHVSLVHSVDSVRLAEALSARAVGLGRDLDCLVQVNVSGEAAKQGFAPDALRDALDSLRGLPALRCRGLMTIAPEAASLDACRRLFSATRDLRDRVRDAELPLPDLSMGMSRDYVQAVLEGATLVRIGTELFRVPSGDPGS